MDDKKENKDYWDGYKEGRTDGPGTHVAKTFLSAALGDMVESQAHRRGREDGANDQ